MHKIKFSLTYLFLSLFLAAAHPAFAQVEALQVIVPSEVRLESTSKKGIGQGLVQAEQEAFANAWMVLKRNPEIGLKTRNLSAEQNTWLAQGLKQHCQSVMIDYAVDKKLKLLSTRYRFDCNLLDVQTSIDSVIRASARAPSDVERPKIATFFIVKEVDSRTTYDANVTRSNKTSVKGDASQSDSANFSYNTDVRSRQSSKEGYGESAGAVTDSLSLRDQQKGQGKGSSSMTTEYATNEETSLQSSGQTISKAADQKYRAASPEDLNSNLTDVFKNGGARINHYADISQNCPGPDHDAVVREFGSTSEDLSTPVRNGIQTAVKKCGFRFLLLGDATVDATQLDPITGSPKVSVIMRAKIWDMGSDFPEVLATVQKNASASNENVNLARSEAVFQVSQRVGEEVLSRLSAEGVR